MSRLLSFAIRFAISRLISSAIRRAFRNISRQSARRANNARLARGRGSLRAAAAREELMEEAISMLEEAEDIILDAYLQAIENMLSMVGNAGQDSVMNSQVIPAFEEAYASSDPEQGWPDVDIGEYMAFMGEIVEEGNSIMESAYNDASSLIDSANEILG